MGDNISLTYITTKVGDGFHAGLSIGKLNVNTDIGDGIAINVLIGKYNALILNTGKFK
jgi:hypothetical protein